MRIKDEIKFLHKKKRTVEPITIDTNATYKLQTNGTIFGILYTLPSMIQLTKRQRRIT